MSKKTLDSVIEFLREHLRSPDARSDARLAIAVEDTVRDIGTIETLQLLVEQLAVLMADNTRSDDKLVNAVTDMLHDRFRELRDVRADQGPPRSLAPMRLPS